MAEDLKAHRVTAAVHAAASGLAQLADAKTAGDYRLARGYFEAAARWVEQLEQSAAVPSVTITRLDG